MLKRLARSAIGLGIVLAAYWLYGMIAVPWIEPPRSAAGDPAPLPPPVSERQAMFESFFPPESWQRTNPKVLESDRGVLLFQEYEPAVDGRIRLFDPADLDRFAPLEDEFSQVKSRPWARYLWRAAMVAFGICGLIWARRLLAARRLKRYYRSN